MDKKSPTLLIVDDSRMSRMLIKAIITDSRPEWRILEAVTGDEAIKLVDEHQPEFVSMDVNMPGIDGLETLADGKTVVKVRVEVEAGLPVDPDDFAGFAGLNLNGT